MFVDALKLLVMPPLCLYLMGLAGLALWKRRPRIARALSGSSIGLLVLLSLPIVAIRLQSSLQGSPPQSELDVGDAQAIVVLGADGNSFAPEYGGTSVGPLTLERLRYGAKLAKKSGLPLLVSAGVMRAGEPPLACAMADALANDFGVTARWREERSADTRENALFSAEILRAEHVERVLVVTHAWHEARALAEFHKAGIDARAAGTGWRSAASTSWGAWFPSARGLRESSWALHEWVGRAWYAIR
ncbi:MAG TPA: YdcF family protein [Planctomycetota bacterium]|nr:YdcF family protein [Planctomycetota bacterium]